MINERRLILHVGQHKTGTSYIQYCLKEHLELLKSAGICYPAEYVPAPGRGQHIIPAVLKMAPPSDEFTKLSAVMKRIQNEKNAIIISSENFCSLTVPQYKRFTSLFDGWDIRAVYVMRRLNSFWPSHWQELVKHGSDIGFKKYLSDYESGVINHNRYPNQRLHLENLASVIGYENINAYCYENFLASEQDIYTRILADQFGIDLPLASNVFKNRSLQPLDVELIRVLNSHVRSTGGVPGIGIRELYLRNISSLRETPDYEDARLAFESVRVELSIEPDRPFIIKTEKDVFQKFGERFVNRHSNEQLFTLDRASKITFAQTRDPDCRQADRSAALLNLLRHLDRQNGPPQ